MKKIFTLFAVFIFTIPSLFFANVQAQDCVPTAYKKLEVNDVSLGVLNGGDMFWDLNNNCYEVPKGGGVNALFAGALWMGGVDDQGSLKLAAQTYRQSGNDFFPGPRPSSEDEAETFCDNFDKIWRVSAQEIADFRSAFENGAIQSPDDIPESIREWPGRNNIVSEAAPLDRELAPFVDLNENDQYDPLLGEYPAIKGDEALWWIYHDEGEHLATEGLPLGVEIKTMAYAFVEEGLEYSTFYDYSITNKSDDPLNGFYISKYIDVDLGCFENDYVGCIPDENLSYGYNATAEDCPNGYGEDLPIIGIKLIKGMEDANGEEQGMSSFIYYNNDFSNNGNPETAEHYYNYLRGKSKTGEDIIVPENVPEIGGNTSSFMYSGNPSQSDEWSECTMASPIGDRRFLMGLGTIDLLPGQQTAFTLGVIWSNENTLLCPEIDQFTEHVNEVVSTYEIQIAADIAAGINDKNALSIAISVFPNPASDVIYLELEDAENSIKEISMLDAAGSTIQVESKNQRNTFSMKTGGLKSGLYFLRIQLGNGNLVLKKVIID